MSSIRNVLFVSLIAASAAACGDDSDPIVTPTTKDSSVVTPTDSTTVKPSTGDAKTDAN